MKKSILLLFAFVAVSTTAFAQDGGSKSLSAYLCGNTGTLNQKTGWEKGDSIRTFEYNWTELGLVFEQGFESGFAYDVSLVLEGYVDVDYADTADVGSETESYSSVLGDYNVDAVSGKVGISYGIGDLGVYASLNTKLLATAGVSYGVGFGAAGSLSVGSDVCFYAMPTDYTGYVVTGYGDGGVYDYESLDSDKAVGILDFFQVYLGYSVGFAENWGFTTKAGFRFGSDYSAFAFVNSFNIRWENTISYQATDALSLYGRVRYQANDLTKKVLNEANNGWVAADVDHRVSLQAGLTYTLDF